MSHGDDAVVMMNTITTRQNNIINHKYNTYWLIIAQCNGMSLTPKQRYFKLIKIAKSMTKTDTSLLYSVVCPGKWKRNH